MYMNSHINLACSKNPEKCNENKKYIKKKKKEKY
jgi:hypothetical protein